MFCGNCGKEIIGNTRFCQFCGAEQTAVVIPAASIPVSSPISEYPDTASAPEAESATAASTPVTADVSSSPAEPPVTSMGAANESVPVTSTEYNASGLADLPTPNQIPTGNISAPEIAVYSSPLPTAAAPAEITIKDEEKPRPERKYSLRHIVMCLAAAAVMAVAAGVFAGLYFSVIL